MKIVIALIFMQKPILPLTFLLLFSGIAYSQLPEQFPVIDKNDLPGAKFQPARIFAGKSLFGYIDGGAELYLEYGFTSAWVSEISLMGGKYKTEIYKMNGPEEAFGIFSVSKYRCKSMPPLSFFTCQTRYQLQICSGPYYVSIINNSGNKTDSIATLNIAEAIISKITEPSANLSSYLPGISLEDIKSKTILAKGKLGLMNGAPDWEDYFKNLTGYILVVCSSNEKTILSVKFNTNEDLKKFQILHNWTTELITTNPVKLSGGESFRKLADNHLLIEIPW